MKKRPPQNVDPRVQTPPGHFLRNAPWRKDFVEENRTNGMSVREIAVLAILVVTSVVVAAALWIRPPRVVRFDQPSPEAIAAQATLAGQRVPRPYNGLGYDPSKFEEVKDDDPLLDDEAEHSDQAEVNDEKPNDEEPSSSEATDVPVGQSL